MTTRCSFSAISTLASTTIVRSQQTFTAIPPATTSSTTSRPSPRRSRASATLSQRTRRLAQVSNVSLAHAHAHPLLTFVVLPHRPLAGVSAEFRRQCRLDNPPEGVDRAANNQDTDNKGDWGFDDLTVFEAEDDSVADLKPAAAVYMPPSPSKSPLKSAMRPTKGKGIGLHVNVMGKPLLVAYKDKRLLVVMPTPLGFNLETDDIVMSSDGMAILMVRSVARCYMSAEMLLKQILASNWNSVHFVNLSSKLDRLAKSAGRLPQITKEILRLPYQCRDTFINEKGEDMDNIIVDQDTYGNQWMYFWVSAYGNKCNMPIMHKLVYIKIMTILYYIFYRCFYILYIRVRFIL